LIEHGDSIRPEAAAEMARRGIFLVPTLTVADYVDGPRVAAGCEVCEHTEKAHAKSFENCRKAGVKIAFGTDAGGFPWTEINQAKEFEYEVKLGMTPIEAIRSATAVAAELLA
jgi:imidazolonepropionase-like amidohydrolase